jgi:transitional endoplasmic reticulum ATPase
MADTPIDSTTLYVQPNRYDIQKSLGGIMFKDQYLENAKKIYAVRAADFMGKTFDEDYFEFAHKQIDPADLAKIQNMIVKKMKEEEAKGRPKKIKRTVNFGPASRAIKRPKIGDESFSMAWLIEKTKELEESKNDPCEWAKELNKVFTSFPNILGEFKRLQEKIHSKSLKKSYPKTEFQNNIEAFSSVFKLSAKEMEIITFLYLDRTDDDVDDYFSNRRLDITNITKSMKYFCRFFELKADELRTILAKDSVLIKAGIVKKSRREDTLELSESVVGFLGGMNKQSVEDDYVKEADLSETLLLTDHNVALDKTQTIKNLLGVKGGCNIILHGHPGTGKTEFAKSLAKETGKRIYFINQSDTGGEESLDFRKQAIIAAHNIIQGDDSIIVVDECDKIININNGMWKCDADEGSDRKAWVNDFLENAKHKIIWISNRINGIDESTKRRFSYSLEFQPLSFAQRKKVWEIQVVKQNIEFVDANDIQNLAKNLKVNSGGITLALKDVQGMESLKTKDEKLIVLKSILSQHQTFTSGEDVGLLKKTSKYDLGIVNSDYPLEKLLSYAGEFLKERATFTSKGVYNLNLLLQGPPGTGKTEFVKHLAEVTDRELLVKRASDIRSKWYGESVRNIAACFKEAEVNGSILFFDEADSFFGSREGGSEYHAEETNELLTQMENFQGVLVCSTNFTQKLDQAAMRRFNYKVKFDYLTNSGKSKMFHTYLSDLCIDKADSLGGKLEKIQGLTPGDFKVVYQKNVFNEKKPASEFLKELENEVSYKNAFAKKVGLS